MALCEEHMAATDLIETVRAVAKSPEWIYGRNTVAFVVETTGCKFGGPDRLRHTVGVAWSSITGCLHSYAEEELGYLAILLDTADVIIAHNSGFDIGVMKLYFNADRVEAWRHRVVDPFEVIRVNEGTWASLGAICEVNNRPTKTGTGLDAITLWNDGKVKQLAEYCAMDVWIMVALLQITGPDEAFWFCQKRYNLNTKVQDHLRAGRVNKRTLEVVMEAQGSFPPNFEGVCPCVKKAKQVIEKRKLESEAEAVAESELGARE